MKASVSQPIAARFSLEEIRRVDQAIRVFSSNFRTRSDFVRFCVLSGLDGFIHNSLVSEAAGLIIAERRAFTASPSHEVPTEGNSAPAAAVQNGRGSVVPITATPETKGELSEK